MACRHPSACDSRRCIRVHDRSRQRRRRRHARNSRHAHPDLGIDAPESSQLCRDDDAKLFRCGARAANDLDAFIGNRTVTCVEVEQDRRYGRSVGVCTVDNTDLAEWLVRNGLAFDYPQYSPGAYADAQRDAEQDERGLWAGSFVMPWQFRACLRNRGRASKCSDQ